MGHRLHIKGSGGGNLDTIRMSMLKIDECWKHYIDAFKKIFLHGDELFAT
jgi:hypothetical protein